MKYNLLPEGFQERFDELEVDWTEMPHAKFLSEAHKCEEADKKARLRKEKDDKSTANKRKRDDSQAGLACNQKNKNDKWKARQENSGRTAAGQARFCELCKASGAPDFVCRSHNTKDCRKKGQYKRLLSGGAGSRQKAKNEFQSSEKKFRREFKVMAKRVKELENKVPKKTRRRGENSDDSSFASSTDDGF